jgi:hypothetical protein
VKTTKLSTTNNPISQLVTDDWVGESPIPVELWTIIYTHIPLLGLARLALTDKYHYKGIDDWMYDNPLAIIAKDNNGQLIRGVHVCAPPHLSDEGSLFDSSYRYTRTFNSYEQIIIYGTYHLTKKASILKITDTLPIVSVVGSRETLFKLSRQVKRKDSHVLQISKLPRESIGGCVAKFVTGFAEDTVAQSVANKIITTGKKAITILSFHDATSTTASLVDFTGFDALLTKTAAILRAVNPNAVVAVSNSGKLVVALQGPKFY